MKKESHAISKGALQMHHNLQQKQRLKSSKRHNVTCLAAGSTVLHCMHTIMIICLGQAIIRSYTIDIRIFIFYVLSFESTRPACQQQEI